MGQVRKSFERLMPGANNRPVTVNIDGIGEVPVHVSPSKTTVFTVTPSDVSAQKTAAQLGTEGLNVQALDVGVSSERLDSVARQLRAEAVKNAPGTAQ
jgi:hypothetical protein